ncbi:hypothetical protein QE152_g32120 [Popillia japonica]|uniref:Retroviral polymerase SH3-like domain-containing protein n=1 Tax=Popillia japonica TaxID=7064 RepID=A0AAW1J037_POPJA
MVMIGYSPNGYRLWNSEENKVATARGVVFDENNRDDTKRELPIETLTEINGDEKKSKIDEKMDEKTSSKEHVRSTRNRKVPVKLQDYETNFMAALATGHLPSEIPTTCEEAISTGWKDTINEELENLKQNEKQHSPAILQILNINVGHNRWQRDELYIFQSYHFHFV